ncbi:DNA mismatch repair protein Msh2-like protein [Leptotrombidium deliense]|uniref:DNA mismatch repair protein Msh2-like protein n=1 Tax=Leptotrombidium deliense TaxID=299467 RepID=A0A443SUU9_9ACAR|nr:DNA mismatch repair protein Msh2-like protein [Leptotrombidium deliense]
MDSNSTEKQIDIANESGFLRFYSELEAKIDTTIRFFDFGDFHIVLGSDAEYISEFILKTKSRIRHRGSSKIPSLTISSTTFTSLLKEIILTRSYRVEIYEKKNEKTDEWFLKTKASPGDLGDLEEIIYSDGESSSARGLLAVIINGSDDVHVGLSFIDSIDETIRVGEFDDNQYLTNFEAILVQLGPRECILPQDNKLTCFKRLQSIINSNNVLLTTVKPQEFKINDVNDEIKVVEKLLRKETNGTDFLEKCKLGLSALSASVNFLRLKHSLHFGQYKLESLDTSSFVRLDSSAISSLNLFSTIKNNGQQKTIDSVFALLNFCKTSAGQRLLAQWIRQPLTDINRIEERLNLVECFVKNVEQRQIIHEDLLRRIPDLIRLAKKLHCKRASLSNCFSIMKAIECAGKIVTKLESLNDKVIAAVFVGPFNKVIKRLSAFQKFIKERIWFDELSKTVTVIPTYNSSLQSENKKIIDIEEKAKAIIKRIARDLGLELGKGLKDECDDSTGFFLRVTKKEERALRTKNYITVKNPKKDGVRFVNEDLEDLNKSYLACRKRYNAHEKEVVTEIIATAASYSDDVRQLGFILSTLDVIVSLSITTVQSAMQFTRPKVVSNQFGKIVLEQVRHPCVEAKSSVSFIPNDIEFDEKKFFLVTGPNMGGKSTYIRSVGICVLLAQMGSFVPAKSATISVVDGIYTRIGASDKQIKGYSTFMMEMIETTSILRSATKNSLVIIDELGRGTSTYEGFGLAWAISRFIASDIKAFCLFATHFHELTKLSNELPSIGNLHVSALTTDGTLTFLYEVKKGSCDQSFGIHVAELASFPKHMLESNAEI